jgi:hypothetical protein
MESTARIELAYEEVCNFAPYRLGYPLLLMFMKIMNSVTQNGFIILEHP